MKKILIVLFICLLILGSIMLFRKEEINFVSLKLTIRGTTNESLVYEFSLVEDGLLCQYFKQELECEKLLSFEEYQQLYKKLSEYRVNRWDGFNSNNKGARDGKSFSFILETKEGKTISARGNNAYPKHYIEVKEMILDLFEGGCFLTN